MGKRNLIIALVIVLVSIFISGCFTYVSTGFGIFYPPHHRGIQPIVMTAIHGLTGHGSMSTVGSMSSISVIMAIGMFLGMEQRKYMCSKIMSIGLIKSGKIIINIAG